MARSRVQARLDQSIQDALEEIGKLAKKNILDAFSGEYGYREDGSRKKWKELNKDYVKRYRKDSSNPILEVVGDLKKAIEVRITKYGIETGVFSTDGKENWAGETTPLNLVSEYLSFERPHTNPSKKFLGDSAFVKKIFDKHFQRATRELQIEGLL